MALSLSIDKTRHRGDSDDWPIATAADFGTYGRMKIGGWQYYNASGSPFDLVLPNRSKAELKIYLRQVDAPSFSLGANVSQAATLFTRTSGTGWVGAYYNTSLSTAKCSIEGISNNINLRTGVSLQNGDVTPTNDFTNAAVAHSIVLDQPVVNGFINNGWITIREAGVVIPNRIEAYWTAGDKVMIELDAGIVRYYLVKPGGDLLLLRATRSKLTVAPKATVLVYDNGAIMSGVVVFNNQEVLQTIETIGALQNFQDWQNDFFHVDTGEAIVMADGESQQTYPNSRRVIRSLTANLNMRTKADRDEFLAFFNYHAQGQEFLFIDKAHTDENKRPTEFFAKFTSPFGDKARGSCLSIHQAQITETMRKDIYAQKSRTIVLDEASYDVDGGDIG